MSSVSMGPTPSLDGHLPRVRLAAVPVAIVAALLTAAVVLALVTAHQARVNEQRLLRLRVRDAGLVLAEALPNLQTPMASLAALSDATGGDPGRFRHFAARYAGRGPAFPFVDLSLWRLGPDGPHGGVSTGAAPRLTTADRAAAARAVADSRPGQLSVVGLTGTRPSRLGYVFHSARSGFAVYGETALAPNRRAPIARNSAFAGLDYAIYLGRGDTTNALLATNVAGPPLLGHVQTVTVPFGAGAFTLVMASPHPLDGALPHLLPWIILGVGLVLAAVVGIVSRSLERRRRAAEALAGQLERIAQENERLYAEQRDIAATLQHALLPETLPAVAGIEAHAGHLAGERGLEIGGDWYDVIEVAPDRLMVIVGDVSGRGLGAATTMAALRYAMRAYVVDGLAPADVLTRLTALLDVGAGGQLATVLCLEVDRRARTLTLASAGHLPPLLLEPESSRYLDMEVGVPIGADRGARYVQTVTPLPDAGAVVAFTDGLVENRTESLDAGLERLRTALTGNRENVSVLIDRLLHERRTDLGADDVAIVGLRWST